MESYNIQIPNEKATTYNVVTLIISIINLLGVCYVLVGRGERNLVSVTTMIIAIGAVMSATSLIPQVGAKSFLRPWVLLSICGLAWLYWGQYYLGVPLLAFAILSFYTAKPLIICVSPKGILYPATPKKLFFWPEIDFVILKDDVLTIELKNNQLFQFTLEPQVAAAINPDEFNSFCLMAASRSL